jgi:signal transduction histidine kinase
MVECGHHRHLGDGERREPGRTPGQLDVPLWRSLAVVRIAALGYAAALVAANFDSYDHPAGGWITIVVMAAWTVVTMYWHLRPGWTLLGADLAVTLACLIATRPIVGGEQLEQGTPIIPIAWLAGPVLAWAVAGGRRAGAAAGAVLGLAVVAVRGEFSQGALTSLVILTLVGIAVGHVARLTAIAEAKLQRATELIAATRERDRLARTIHDSVLQVLANWPEWRENKAPRCGRWSPSARRHHRLPDHATYPSCSARTRHRRYPW